jgi:6-pyruvoyltetrahydropterin/6-carboxytetrahydropterin synthase
MFEIKVRTSFSAAHRLTGYEGKCANLHGHTWRVEVAFRSGRLDDRGMVADFYEIKPALTEVVEKFDHKYINDIEPFDKISPTSENLAEYFFDRLKEKNEIAEKIFSVTVSESESTSATYFAGREED